MARRPQYRPGTRLAVVALLLLASYLYVGISGDTPRLGIDLNGGTEVTLQPKTEAGKAPTADALNQAVDILRERVDGLGVSEANVARQGNDIVVTVPGTGRSAVLNTIGSTAKLFIRQVDCMQSVQTCTDVTGASSTTTPTTTTAPATTIPSTAASASPGALPTSSVSASVLPAGSNPSSVASALGDNPSPSATAHGRPLPDAVGAAYRAASASATVGASTAPSASASASAKSSRTASASVSPTPRPSGTASATASGSAKAAGSPSPAPSASPSPSLTPAQQQKAETDAMTCVRAGGTPAETGKTVTCKAGTGSCTATAKKADLGKACAIETYDVLDCSLSSNKNIGAQDLGYDYSVGCDKSDSLGYLLFPSPTIATKAGVPVVFDGTQVTSPSAQPSVTNTGQTQIVTGQWEVDLNFTKAGSKAFNALSTKTAALYSSTSTVPQNLIGIVLDGVVQSAPSNQQALSGPISITGNFTQSTADSLANVLKYGALPLSFQDQPQSVTVSATLGRSQLNAGLLAGGLGLALVILYCFFYYRALGLVTVASLAVSGLAVYATITLLGRSVGYTLSLAGVAGFIVAVGITADSFVVFFERIKDEFRDGRSPRSAVESGWHRARRTILQADSVSLLAAVILYVFSIGDVRGFAFTLGVSTALDIVTVFLFTKPIVTILIRRKFFSSGRFSGLTSSAPDAPLRRRAPISRRPTSAGPETSEA